MHVEITGDDVFRPGAGVNVGYLKTGRREMFVAAVPLGLHERQQRRREI
jgi:hypothetical protein